MNPEHTRIGQTRSVFKRDHALIAPDGHVISPLPAWNGARGVVLLSPAMGANLAQTLVSLEPGIAKYQGAPGIEAFVYVLEGELRGEAHPLRAGSHLFLPPETAIELRVETPSRLVVFEKRYAPLASTEVPRELFGHESEAQGQPFLGDPDAVLQVLLPETPDFDMAVNIFTYKPGATLPFAETHVMEHGLLMLDGEGIYRLGDSWYPVAAGDAIWMAPFCPQWFAATGKVPSRYIYFKNINRDAMDTII